MEPHGESKNTQPVPRLKIRIESLSDLVFGLALSIGSIILIGKTPSSGQDIAINVLLFGFGFLIIVLAWLGYSRTMAVLPVEVPLALLSNIALLFTVALEPYLFYVLIPAQTDSLANSASLIYALDVGGMFLLQAVLAGLVLRESKANAHGQQPLHPVTLARFRRVVASNLVSGFAFAVSALPVFWIDTPVGYLRFYLWSVSFVVFPYIYAARRRTKTAAKESA